VKYWHTKDPAGANLDAAAPQSGDILVNFVNGSSKELGKAAMYSGELKGCIVTTNLFIVRFDENNIRAEFANYYFQSDLYRKWLLVNAGFSGQGSFNKAEFSKLAMPCPEISKQLKIVEILRTWDEAIEKLGALRTANLRRRIWLRSHVFTGRTRLPGFSGDWSEITLRQVLTEHGLQGTGSEEVFSVSVHKGLINQIEHLGRSFAAADTGHYNRVLPGDIVYTKSPTGEFPLGIIKQSKLKQGVIVSPLYGVFTPASRALGVILDALFESPIAVRNYLSPLVQKGAKNTIAITNRRFLEGKLLLPMDPKEQAAIANVIETSQAELAAIDTEIKLLTQQKRGLMQKLLTGEWRVKVDGDEGVAA
jgi:type I restriction enzyme, S subunit